MSDIVERLKDAFDHNAVCHCGSGIGECDNHDFCWMPDDDTQMLSDAKHEIERLRARVAELEADRDRWKAEAMAWREWWCHPDTEVHREHWEMRKKIDAARAANGEVGQ